jgi:hypothetical protein
MYLLLHVGGKLSKARHKSQDGTCCRPSFKVDGEAEYLAEPGLMSIEDLAALKTMMAQRRDLTRKCAFVTCFCHHIQVGIGNSYEENLPSYELV